MERRLVGIDLGIASAHRVRVLDASGRKVCRRRCEQTAAGFGQVEQAALAGAAAGTRLEVVIEPTGPAWLPVAVFFTCRGHTVYRVSSAKASDLRRFLSRHAKSNGIDADPGPAAADRQQLGCSVVDDHLTLSRTPGHAVADFVVSGVSLDALVRSSRPAGRL